MRLPAEWEPQTELLLIWPHAQTDWAPRLAAVERLYQQLIAQVTQAQPVCIVCADTEVQERAAHQLAPLLNQGAPLRWALAASNDTWMRDCGPLTVLDAQGAAQLVDFRFNGWGGKYRADDDDQLCQRLHDAGVFGDQPLIRSTLVAEGGALDTDGQGTLLVMQRTLLDPNRNPGWSMADIERECQRGLGIERILWLTAGHLEGDDTDGHIDTLARFCDPQTIVYASTEPADSDAPALNAMRDQLQQLRQPNGAPYRLLAVPQPAPIIAVDGARLPATYLNFVLVNGALIVPTYDDPKDATACSILATAFPDRQLWTVDARVAIEQGGSLHCLTMHRSAGLEH